MIRAHKSADRKYVVCGACGRSLCRRDRRERPGGLPREVNGRRVPGTETVHTLVWGDGWHVVDDHIEMMPSAFERLRDGHKPGRHDWTNEERFALSRAVREYVPAVCPWCGTTNEIDPKPLDVDGVAAY